MIKSKKYAIIIFWGLSLIILLGCNLSSQNGIGVNAPAPDFTLASISGPQISLSQYRGKPVLLNFWATWCGPCIQEIPIIQSRFERHYPDLVVLAIEDGSSVKEIDQVRRELDTSFRVLRGTSDVMRQYNISAYPTTYFIDPDGVIRFIVVGSLTASELDRELDALGLAP